MTTDELNTIVAAVVAELEKSGVDFDYKAEQAEDDDLVFVIRGTAPNYQGVTVTWKGLLDIITAQATQAKTDAVNAKDIAQQILTQVQSKGTEITNFVATSKTEIETQKNESVNAVKSVYQTDLDELKGDISKQAKELDNKKITKFYASSLGNTNLPDSDNGKPTDMIIYGKSVQDGTPTPDNPIEIQSVVNPKVSVYGNNLVNATLGTTTKNGITITNNGDGTYTLNGTSTVGVGFNLSTSINIMIGKQYAILSSIMSGMYISLDNIDQTMLTDKTTKRIFTTTKKKYDALLLWINSGIKVNNFVLNPMITANLNAILDDFEPYKEQTATLPYTLNAIPVSSNGNVTIDGQQYIADYVDVERKKLVRHIRYGNPFTGYNWNLNSNYNFWYCDSSDYSKTKNLIKIPQDNNSNVHSLWKDGIISTEYKFYNGNVSAEKAFGVGTSGIVFYRNTSVTSTSYNGCQGTFKNENFYYELPTPTETDLTDAELEAFKALETYYPVTNVFVTSDQVDGATVFNYPLNMANGWNYVMEQIGETRPIIYDTEVKVLENAIDTAILTAMMEA